MSLANDQERVEDFDDSDDEHAGDSSNMPEVGVEYTADIPGRTLGEQPVPRYDINKLQPFEVMFADNKDYPVTVRGGKQIAFVLICYKFQAKFKIDLMSKADNGWAFKRVCFMNGIHKLPYRCCIWTDGCESMKHVMDVVVLAGIDHVYTPPREPSLNEAEKVCNSSREIQGTSQSHDRGS